jgi:hypothetical protein
VTWDQILVWIIWPAIAATGIGGFVFWVYLPTWSGFAARCPHDRSPLPETLLPPTCLPVASIWTAPGQQTGPPIAVLSERPMEVVDGDQLSTHSRFLDMMLLHPSAQTEADEDQIARVHPLPQLRTA